MDSGSLDKVTLADVLIKRFVDDTKRGFSNPTVERAYYNSNEDLKLTFSCIDVKEKRVMVIGSSGDQLLHAISHGAKEVVVYDLNPLTEVACEYKMAFIKNFSYDEFINLAFSDYLNYKVYQKISHDLSGEARKFWDYIMLHLSTFDCSDEEFAYDKEELFKRIFFMPSTVWGVREYEDDKHIYEKLQKRLIDGDYKISYINDNILDFEPRAMGEFDVILLSNVLEWTENWESEFIDAAEKIYNESLASGGTMEIFYNFRADRIFANKKLDRIILEKFKNAIYTKQKVNDKTKIHFLVKPEEAEMI